MCDHYGGWPTLAASSHQPLQEWAAARAMRGNRRLSIDRPASVPRLRTGWVIASNGRA